MSPRNDPALRPRWQFGAAIAAWLFPGLGHFVLGDRRRGLILMFTIPGLYVAGLLIGGIDVIDSREDRIAYVGQIMAGPVTFVLDNIHQNTLKPATERQLRRTFPGSNPPDFQSLPYIRSVGRVNELGTLYCAMAGLLNLLVIIEVIYRDHSRQPAPPTPVLAGRIVRREGAGP